MGASYIPELNIRYDHKRWKVVDLRVKTESPISRSLNPVNRIGCPLQFPCCQLWAFQFSCVIAELLLALLRPKQRRLGSRAGAGWQPPHDSSLREGVERDVLDAPEQQRHNWQQRSLELLKWNSFFGWEMTCFISVGFLLSKIGISFLLL